VRRLDSSGHLCWSAALSQRIYAKALQWLLGFLSLFVGDASSDVARLFCFWLGHNSSISMAANLRTVHVVQDLSAVAPFKYVSYAFL